MNMLHHNNHRIVDPEVAESRFARSIVARLTEGSQQVAPEIGERLRFARETALETARRARADGNAHGVGIAGDGTALLGFSRSPWWARVGSVLPVIALVGGLVLIQERQAHSQISVAAEVDAALLGDDLPINAYRDPGFVEFLKAPPTE